jgi:tetratricopeptide (TPR) repeat protein
MKTYRNNYSDITRKNFKTFLMLLTAGFILTCILSYGAKAQTLALFTNDKAVHESAEPARTNNFEKGIIALQSKDEKNAIRYFSSAIEEDSKNAESFNNRGIAYAKIKAWKNAMKDFTAAINLDSTSAQYYYSRGLAENKAEKYAACIRDCDKALQLQSNNAEAYLVRGISKALLDDASGSMTDFRSALSYKPDYAEAYYNIGLNYYESHDDVNAKSYLKKAKALGFENPELSEYLEN